jgi:hypothetical protein
LNREGKRETWKTKKQAIRREGDPEGRSPEGRYTGERYANQSMWRGHNIYICNE